MAKCIDGISYCIFYLTAEMTGDEPGCASGGNVSKPTEEVYCAEIDGDRETWEIKQYGEEPDE